MSHVQHEVTMQVPAERIFAALLHIPDVPKWMVNLEEVHNITGDKQGDGFEWTYKMAGTLTFHGRTVFSTVQPHSYLREDGSGDLTNTWEWWLTPEGNATRVKARVDYSVPGGALLGGILDKLFVERQNQKDLEQSMQNLKKLLEQG